MPKTLELSNEPLESEELFEEQDREAERKPKPKKKQEQKSGKLSEEDYRKMSIWQAMAQMTRDDWSDKVLYIYRLSPKTVNRTTGDHSYIDKRVEALDEDTLKAMYGGGTFQLILNSINPSSHTLVKVNVKIPGNPIFLKDEMPVTEAEKPQAPGAPVVQGTSVDDTIKLIHAVQAMGGREKQENPKGDALAEAINLVATGAQKGMEITAAQASKSGVSIEKLLELALTPRAKEEDPIVKRLMELLLERAFNSSEKPPSLKERLEEMRELQELIQLQGGGRGRASNDGLWGVLAQAAAKAADSLPDLIRALRSSPVGPAPVARPYYGQPAAPMLAPGPAVAVQPSPEPAVNIDPQVLIKARIVRAFVDGDNGQFVGWYLEKEAPGIFQALRGRSLEEVKTFLATDPVLKELLDKDGSDEFLNQILEYANEDEISETIN